MITASELIVLRKVPYKESSLLVSGLSPEFGRFDFIAKGAGKISKKKFPAIDLFRIISIDMDPEKTSLQSIYKAEIVKDFDAVALVQENYREACAIASFVLRNTKPLVGCELLFKAVRTAFSRLCAKPCVYPCFSLVKLAYLAENGFLPEPDGKIPALLAAASGESDELNLKEDGIKKISLWLDALCTYHGINNW